MVFIALLPCGRNRVFARISTVYVEGSQSFSSTLCVDADPRLLPQCDRALPVRCFCTLAVGTPLRAIGQAECLARPGRRDKGITGLLTPHRLRAGGGLGEREAPTEEQGAADAPGISVPSALLFVIHNQAQIAGRGHRGRNRVWSQEP